MGEPAKKQATRKGHGHMERPPDLIEATMRMDLEAIKSCLEADPDSIHQVDDLGNNVVHLCIGGGSPRTLPIMKFFVEETPVNLLHENQEGRMPLDLAIAINDELSVDLLEEPTHAQLTKAYAATERHFRPM